MLSSENTLKCCYFCKLICRSFGHFQAHEYALTNGFSEDLQNSRIGFAKTRQSVTKVFFTLYMYFYIIIMFNSKFAPTIQVIDWSSSKKRKHFVCLLFSQFTKREKANLFWIWMKSCHSSIIQIHTCKSVQESHFMYHFFNCRYTNPTINRHDVNDFEEENSFEYLIIFPYFY